jgi:hypothetical protein
MGGDPSRARQGNGPTLIFGEILHVLVECPCVATDLKFIFTFNTCKNSTYIMLLYYHPLSGNNIWDLCSFYQHDILNRLLILPNTNAI